MIDAPERQVSEFVRAGAHGVTVHVEASTDVAATLAAIRSAGARPGLALNPPTPLEHVRPFLHAIDLLLVMSVNPGWAGQPFVEGSLEKLAAARELRRETGGRFEIESTAGSSHTTRPPRRRRAPTFSWQARPSSRRPTTPPRSAPSGNRGAPPLELPARWRSAARSARGDYPTT